MPGYLYDDHLEIRDALQIYFSKYHFKDGGYHLKWFKIKTGPFFISLPNIKARVDAVKMHDVHHVLTGYPATYKGEAEIGGWEIASGCGSYYIAWLLNFGSFFIGILFFQRPLLKAFLAGKRCKTNLYHDFDYDEKLIHQTVGEVRKMVGIDEKKKNAIMDYFYFFFCCLITLAPALVFVYTVYQLVRMVMNLFV